MNHEPPWRPRNRRWFLNAAGGAVLAAACARAPQPGKTESLPDAIARVEAARPRTGRIVAATLAAQPVTVDLGGPLARTVAYGPTVPAPLIRASVGDELAVTVHNRLDRATSVHWHGLALRNDMDGAKPATADIAAGNTFTYRFTAPHPGTYWAHPHTGMDADYGLYLPVVVDDPTEAGDYDAEWIVVLDDWTAGVGPDPVAILNGLRSGSQPMPGMGGGATGSGLLGGDAGDVAYPYFLINGRIPAAPTTCTAKSGQRLRIRLINAGSDTAFRVALAGHTLTVTHTDGYPVRPREVDALLIGMGERYDVIVTAGDGVFPLVASAEGKPGSARALLSTGAGSVPQPNFRPVELDRRIGLVDAFTAPGAAELGGASPDLVLPVALTGNMMRYDWGINGKPYADATPMMIHEGQRVLLNFENKTTMWHPMHLHGHTFQMLRADGSRGARKDTVIVLPGRRLSVVLVADNPGVWMMHCHNTYHQEAGMMTAVEYRS